MIKRILFLIIAISILLFSFSVVFAADSKLAKKIDSGLTQIKKWLIQIATPAAAVAIGTGVLMKKFSFGDEERIVTRQKTDKKYFIFLCFYIKCRSYFNYNPIFDKIVSGGINGRRSCYSDYQCW